MVAEGAKSTLNSPKELTMVSGVLQSSVRKLEAKRHLIISQLSPSFFHASLVNMCIFSCFPCVYVFSCLCGMSSSLGSLMLRNYLIAIQASSKGGG